MGQVEKGKHVILVIDTQGALQLRGKIPAIFVFIGSPSLQELRERLFKRKTGSLRTSSKDCLGQSKNWQWRYIMIIIL